MQHYLIGVVFLGSFLSVTLWRRRSQAECRQHSILWGPPSPAPKPGPTAPTGSPTPHEMLPFNGHKHNLALAALPRTWGTTGRMAVPKPGTAPLLGMLSLTFSRKRSMGTLMKMTSRMVWMMMMVSFSVFLFWICWMLLRPGSSSTGKTPSPLSVPRSQWLGTQRGGEWDDVPWEGPEHCNLLGLASGASSTMGRPEQDQEQGEYGLCEEMSGMHL